MANLTIMAAAKILAEKIKDWLKKVHNGYAKILMIYQILINLKIFSIILQKIG